ncbi:RNA helicase [Candidatus Methylomirabilis lanthanidiphila]|uniref:RNA helicase n=1 Tax=Candidatus Methylomirabilis lanthanidiphila TaxID=2211376 RepID=A0A564ZNG0_9BACT|nr:DEAD/DEAH box helicase [Candidatus Methylomirabilis lanthanidiphila]VUZ86192.1 RNA helicase [Candidatus Methylomirabilis lanthanidiphila]
MKTFDAFSLPESICKGIEAAGFTRCTPIQAETLPLALAAKDVAGQAQTGSGKTAAFLIPLFVRLLTSKRPTLPGAPRALILAPTRELAVQILWDVELLGGFTGLTRLAVYGGVDYQKQRDALQQNVDILIGTPGRLIDYLKQGVYELSQVEVLVVDEADRMFDMGFIKDLRFLLRRLPPYHKRQSLLFSATLSFREMELSYEFMNNPTKVAISPEQVTVDKVEHVLFHVEKQEKFRLLRWLLHHESWQRILIFSNTRQGAERLTAKLVRCGLMADLISGSIDQRKRLRIIAQFKAGTLPILVATDVASRGLHVEAVSHVINYDLPQDPEDYVHRIGRTARAGAAGKAISLADEEYVLSLDAIERYIGFKIPVQWPDESIFAQGSGAGAAAASHDNSVRHGRKAAETKAV